MDQAREKERRRSERHPASLSVVLREAPALETLPSIPSLSGEMWNISGGGFCAQVSGSSRDSVLLQCEISVAGFPVAIPTLAYVRWVKNGKPKSLVGLEFLLH
jgi:PilZ domain